MTHKFGIGDKVKNTRTGKIGLIAGFDFDPEVYSVNVNGRHEMWGELEMVAIPGASK